MMALALGPGSGVLMSGAFIFSFALGPPRRGGSSGPRVRPQAPSTGSSISSSLTLPSRTSCGVFEDDAAGVEVLPDSVGFGEIAGGPRGAPRLDPLLDLGDRHRRQFVLGAPER